MYENWKILKADYEQHADEYAEVANWCNETGSYTIVDDGEYYRVVPVEVPEIETNEEVVEDSGL